MTADTLMRVHKEISDLKYPMNLVGSNSFRDGVIHFLKNPHDIGYMSAAYFAIEKKYGVSSKNIERNLRTLASTWWKDNQCSGLFAKKPKVSELMHTVATKIAVSLEIY